MCSESAKGISSAVSKNRTAIAACVVALAVGGCRSSIQSALHPGGPAADALAGLTWVVFVAATGIFLVVLALGLYAVFRDPSRRRRVSPTFMIVAGGCVLPAVVLTALLVYGVGLTGALRAQESEKSLAIRVTAHQYWWEIRYPDARAGEFVSAANEMRLPVGRPVSVELTSADVIHSFWVPALAGKVDVIPGRVTRLTLEAARPGIFRGQCAEFCGASHAHMAFDVLALPADEFERWLAHIRTPARMPGEARAQKGRQAFVAEGCAHCHAVRGLSTPQLPGPDLTHFGSRAYIGAGALTNTREHRIAWLVNGERVKPGRAMPSYPHLDRETLTALSDFLGSLQ